jgi:lactoylglutathione lyase
MVALSLVVIRAADIERAASFYTALGLELHRESHGNGPEHYVAEMAGLVFEIYPLAGGKPPTTEVRLGFRVADVDAVVERITGAGVEGSLVVSPRQRWWASSCHAASASLRVAPSSA